MAQDLDLEGGNPLAGGSGEPGGGARGPSRPWVWLRALQEVADEGYMDGRKWGEPFPPTPWGPRAPSGGEAP